MTDNPELLASRLRKNLEVALRRAGGIPRLARTAEGRKVIVSAAVAEAAALFDTRPTPSPPTGERAEMVKTLKSYAKSFDPAYQHIGDDLRRAAQMLATPAPVGEEVKVETYDAMHEIACGLGYPSILEALEDLDRLKSAVGEEAVERLTRRFYEARPATGSLDPNEARLTYEEAVLDAQPYVADLRHFARLALASIPSTATSGYLCGECKAEHATWASHCSACGCRPLVAFAWTTASPPTRHFVKPAGGGTGTGVEVASPPAGLPEEPKPIPNPTVRHGAKLPDGRLA